jgi:nucleotide-binding universal stress UspA family protein
MIQTILLPLDGSVWAEAAVPHAVALASRLGARLLLVRAVRVRALPGQDAWTVRARATEVVHAYLARIAAVVQAMSPSLPVGVAMPSGSPCQAILDEATLEQAGLIVMTSHGATGLTPRGVGRVAAGVMANGEVPVLLVRPSAPAGAACPVRPHLADTPWLRQRVRVLVAMDGTPAAKGSLEFVARLGAFVTLSVTLLHVLRPPGDGSRGAREQGLAFHLRHPQWAMAAYCQRAVTWLGSQGVAARVEIRWGDVVRELVHVAQQGEDIVVCGFHVPQTALRWSGDHLMDRIARAAPVPVLVVPSRRTEHVSAAGTSGAVSVACGPGVAKERPAPHPSVAPSPCLPDQDAGGRWPIMRLNGLAPDLNGLAPEDAQGQDQRCG